MNKSTFIILLALVGCNPVSEPEPKTNTTLAEQELAAAREVPSYATTQLQVSGVDRPLYGALQLIVGPGDEERYQISAFSGDGAVSFQGEIDLTKPGLVPSPGDDGEIVTSFKPEDGFDWLAKNRGSFSTVVDGVEKSHAIRSADIRIDGDGLFVAELRGVDVERIEAKNRRIKPGDDTVVTLRGRLIGSCLTQLPTGAVVMDPANQNPRCVELFSAL